MKKALKTKLGEISIDLIDEPRAVARLDIDPEPVKELALSISELGLLQPIVIREAAGRYEIIAGHRRYLAHKLIGLESIKASVVKMSDKDTVIARATENLRRVDLTPMEEAAIYSDLVNVHKMDFEEIGKKMGKTAGTIKRRLDLVKMPPILQNAVHQKLISMTVAEELWPIADLTSLEYYLTFAIENGCTKEVARQWCKDWKDSERRSDETGELPGGHQSPQEPRPYYVACDLCNGPAEMSTMVRMSVCPVCYKTIKENM